MTKAAGGIAADPLIGQVLGGRYIIDRLIARGGMGLVYTANVVGSTEQVVVKVLASPWTSDTQALARFEREAERLSAIEHPNIVAMHDYGYDGDTAYLVMEYLDGEVLSRYLARHRTLTMVQFVPIAAQVLKGVGHVHSRGMILRDIKPGNIMLCERKGRANFVKLLDFGLAKFIKDEAPLTDANIIGTLGYLSPEQIQGKPLDLAVDVYALGVLFYHMLSGQTPFGSEGDAATLYRTLEQVPPNLQTRLPFGSGVPDALVDLIHQCLAKDPADRPVDANHIIEGLVDVVPSALFRLPKAEVSPHGPTRTIVRPASKPDPDTDDGDTGLRDLLRKMSASSSMHRTETSVAANDPQGAPTADVPPLRRHDGGSGGRPRLMAAFGAGAILVAALLVGWEMLSDRTPPSPSVATASVTVPVETDARLPGGSLGTARDPVLGEPLDPLDPLKGTGTIVTEVAPTLRAEPADPFEAKAIRASISIDSTPTARLTIDERPSGATPFQGPLAVGEHRVRLSADGYEDWDAMVRVVEGSDPNVVRVSLNKKDDGESSDEPREPSRAHKPSRHGGSSTGRALLTTRDPTLSVPSSTSTGIGGGRGATRSDTISDAPGASPFLPGDAAPTVGFLPTLDD